MRRTTSWLAQGLIVALAAVCGCAGPGAEPAEPVPELLAVSSHEATIGWRSSEPGVGSVSWRPATGEGQPRQVVEPQGATVEHAVTLTGLQPGKLYRYRLGGGKQQYTFRTDPGPGASFSLLLVWGDAAQLTDARLRDEPAELLVSLDPLPRTTPDPLQALRPALPVFDPGGRSSPLLEARGEQSGRQRGSWALDWGGLRLVFFTRPDDLGRLAGLLDAAEAQTVGLVVALPVLEAVGEPLAAALAEQGQRSPQRPVSFVLVSGSSDSELEVRDGIRYLPLGGAGSATGALRLEVEPESCRAVRLADGQAVVLRPPPLMLRRTCEECRQLADQGRYEESLAAYRQFVADHADHYQVDDALQAIAELLDHKLFRLPEAVAAYHDLLQRYPASPLVPLARQRLAYLQELSDCGWEPLARFERIRLLEMTAAGQDAAAREALLRQVDALLDRHRACALAPRLASWLASQQRVADPLAAVARYRQLAVDFPGHPLARDAPVEIAGTLYEAQRYGEAVVALRAALQVRPDLAGELLAQLARAERNQRRRHLALAAWVLLALLAVAALLRWRSAPLRLARLLACSAAAFAVLAGILLLGGWLIAEQFWSPGQRYALALLPAAAAVLGGVIGRRLADGLLPGARPALRLLVGSLLGLAFLAAAVYLTLFHVNEHYLVVVGL